MVDSQMH